MYRNILAELQDHTVKLRTSLGAFAKVRKVTINFVLSVRPPVCLSAWNNSAPSAQILMTSGACSKNLLENSSFIII